MSATRFEWQNYQTQVMKVQEQETLTFAAIGGSQGRGNTAVNGYGKAEG